MKNLAKALLLTSALITANTAFGQETLVFGTTNPEQHPINTGFLTPWAERINADANGAVTIDLRHGPAIPITRISTTARWMTSSRSRGA